MEDKELKERRMKGGAIFVALRTRIAKASFIFSIASMNGHSRRGNFQGTCVNDRLNVMAIFIFS